MAQQHIAAMTSPGEASGRVLQKHREERQRATAATGRRSQRATAGVSGFSQLQVPWESQKSWDFHGIFMGFNHLA